MSRNAVLLILILSVIFGCNTSETKNSDLPTPDHIIVVIEENHGFDQVIGAPEAPYINKLAEEGALFTNSHGVTHPSQPNYIALYSGDLQGVEGDECLEDTVPYTTSNLGAALIKAGHTFVGYGEDMPYEGYRGCYYKKSELTGSSLYGRKHCPWVNWLGSKKENRLPDSISRPMTAFPSDFSKLPTVAFVIPNMDNDMHNHSENFGDSARISTADQWIKDNLSGYIEWAKTHNSLFIFTFDEDDFTPKNRIPTIFAGPMVEPGKYNDSINHYNVLRTIEQMYNLEKSGAAEADFITKVWK